MILKLNHLQHILMEYKSIFDKKIKHHANFEKNNEKEEYAALGFTSNPSGGFPN